jgi:pimeloyl-ACP methyl ester carboxylesterase
MPRPPRSNRPPRRTRRLVLGAAALAAVSLVAGLVLRGEAPVGHFVSAAAQDRFRAAYDRALADLPDAERVLDVRTSFGVVRIYRYAGTGAAEPLVLLPGRASASPVWADNLPSLLRLADVYTLDLLGEPGLSVQDRPIASDADQAQWLHEVLVALPEPRLHLVGVSIGGWTATNLALHQPAKVASLTLVEPVLVLDDLALEAVVRSIPGSVRWLPKAWRDSFGSWTAGGAPVEDVPVAVLIEAGMQAYALRLPPPSRIAEPDLANLRLPVLVLLGGRSPMHDSAVAAETAARALPGASVEVFPEATHALNGEHPQEVADAVGRLLARAG